MQSLRLKQGLFLLCIMLFSCVSISNADSHKDINTATVKQLMEVKGVGKKSSAAIVEYRTKQGKIKAMSELLSVKGIGKKTLVKIEALFAVIDKSPPKPVKESHDKK